LVKTLRIEEPKTGDSKPRIDAKASAISGEEIGASTSGVPCTAVCLHEYLHS